ncbi:basic phospholipase A2 3-like [Physella acuta]|uniref:basic phospholipase A2 3-like n=1 Tax=Physella acuta TaxID=109671 RepID=UPI0027DAF472|nr:basic phospholipase A2 3-like [Physella acuta]
MMPLLLLLTAGGFQCTQGLPRLKRDLQNLCLVFQTYVPRSCMDFSSYGCSCGPNKARAPIDGIDSCCAAKDRCYAKLSCDYNIPTEVKCKNGSCRCTAADKSSCAYKACKCDVKAAKCFTRYTFNESLINYDYTKCAKKIKKGSGRK